MLWLKAFHIIFMVTWFAGLFYLPRLFVYHAQTHDVISQDRFVTMERKLFIMMSIGAMLTLLFGIWIILTWKMKMPLWLHVKLALVLGLLAYHVACFQVMKAFRAGKNTRSQVFYRWFNEIPALFLIAIVLLAVGKPF